MCLYVFAAVVLHGVCVVSIVAVCVCGLIAIHLDSLVYVFCHHDPGHQHIKAFIFLFFSLVSVLWIPRLSPSKLILLHTSNFFLVVLFSLIQLALSHKTGQMIYPLMAA